MNVYGVPAYSTLGYSNWLGGDPLSTFIAWPEGDFVRLVAPSWRTSRSMPRVTRRSMESYATAGSAWRGPLAAAAFHNRGARPILPPARSGARSSAP